jgi:hypothetical protein
MIRRPGGKHEREASGGRGYRLLAALACSVDFRTSRRPFADQEGPSSWAINLQFFGKVLYVRRVGLTVRLSVDNCCARGDIQNRMHANWTPDEAKLLGGLVVIESEPRDRTTAHLEQP